MTTNILLEAIMEQTARTGDDWLCLTIREQSPKTTGRHGWLISEREVRWRPSETAFIVVDMWDTHWSWGATERVNILAPRIDQVLRAWVLEVPQAEPPPLLDHDDPPLPIDDSDHGSDTGEPTWSRPWTRQHPAIEIMPGDAITDDGQEVYNILKHKGIENIIYAGVHTNMCVLNRSFAIKRMVRWAFNVVLARDLTDAMYNPMMPPYVSHEQGTRLVIEYIEKFWCPTITSDDLTATRGT